MTPLRLVIDLARRRWKGALFWFAFQPFNMVSIAQHKEWPFVIDPLAVALLITGSFLPITISVFNARELYQLPVSRRTWWQSLWLLRAVALPGLVGLAVALRQQESYALVWSDRCVVYPVTLMIASAVIVRVTPVLLKFGVARPGSNAGNVLSTAAVTIGALPFGLLVFISPFFVAPHLPHVLADFSVWWILGYAAAAVYGAGSFFHEPPIIARYFARPSALVNSSPRRMFQVPDDAPRAERLTGLRLVLYLQARRRLIGVGVAMAGAVVFWAIVCIFTPMPSLPEAFVRVAVLPFAAPRFDLAFFPLSLILLVVLMVDSGPRALNLLVLRSLPLPGWRVASLPVLTGVATAAMIYATQVSLYVLSGHVHFVTWRIDVLVIAAATLAVVDLLRLVSPGSGSAVVLALVGIPLFRTDLHMILSQSTYFAAGCGVLAATWLASWYLVARSAYGYRRPRLLAVARGARLFP